MGCNIRTPVRLHVAQAPFARDATGPPWLGSMGRKRRSTARPQPVPRACTGSPADLHRNRYRAQDVGVAEGRIPQHIVVWGLDCATGQAYIRPAARPRSTAAGAVGRRPGEAAETGETSRFDRLQATRPAAIGSRRERTAAESPRPQPRSQLRHRAGSPSHQTARPPERQNDAFEERQHHAAQSPPSRLPRVPRKPRQARRGAPDDSNRRRPRRRHG
jgi:hypothetical protein